MLHYAVVFFVIALIAALFGFGGIAAGAAGIAKILFVVFIILAIATFLFGRNRGAIATSVAWVEGPARLGASGAFALRASATRRRRVQRRAQRRRKATAAAGARSFAPLMKNMKHVARRVRSSRSAGSTCGRPSGSPPFDQRRARSAQSRCARGA